MPEVTVAAHQPLALGTRPRAGAPAPTHLHVPGTVLRGALAARWLIDHGVTHDREPPEEFQDLFERDVRFGPLFAPGSAVPPLSVLRCKYHPEPDCERARWDEAFDDVPSRCPHCDGALARGRGEVEVFGAGHDALGVRTTRVALTAEETAADGALYTRDALRHRGPTGEPMTFTGRIVGGGDWLLADHPLVLGGRRSTSGLADYHATPDRPRPPAPPVGRRLVLRLDSPAVLVDAAGRPADRPDLALLGALLEVRVTTVDRAWVRRDRVGGWNAAADLPKPDEHVVTAGSTFVLDLADEPDPAAVRALVDRGIGLRRTEGYGWIDVAVGPWQPPDPRPPTPDTAPDRVAVGMSGMLIDLPGGHARWFVGQLRSYLEYRSGGGVPHADLLGFPRLRTLTTRQRGLIEALLLGDLGPIEAVINALDARIRGVW